MSILTYSLYAGGVDYNELINLKEKALYNAEQYHELAGKYVEKTKEISNEIDINKEEFLEQQRLLLDSAYKIQGKPKYNQQVFVFISFSMPDEAIKQLLVESKKYNAVLIIQGLIDDSFSKTLNKIADVTKKSDNIGGIQIDPNLFQEYKINAVPAYALNYKHDDYDIVYGLGSIKGALEVFDRSEAKELLSHV